MRIILYLGILLISIPLKAQRQEGHCHEQLLLAALYLNTSAKAKKVIKRTFRKDLRRAAIKNLNLKINPSVDYIGIWPFEELLHSDSRLLNIDEINDWRKHQELYNFSSYTIGYFPPMEDDSSEGLFLSFSKPIENYLVAKITSLNPNTQYNKGRVLHVLFIFSDDNSVIDVLYSAGYLG